jgi:hypothetical protein
MVSEVRETSSLIASDKVEGTTVYGENRERIGSIERVMIEKESGKVAYAVLSFGGVLGIGDDHYPLPWNALKFDRSLGGYVTKISPTQLQSAPKYATAEDWDWDDAQRGRAVNDYYGVPLTGV